MTLRREMRAPPLTRRRNAEAGLTVLELMIVLVILSLVGVVVGAQVVQQLDRAKVDIAKLQLRQLQSALTLFQLDVRRYPTSEESVEALLNNSQDAENWRGPYLKNADLLTDPWGRLVTYESEGDRFVLSSLGADRAVGGEGAAADIVLSDAE
jgi:general secretion pathway protein G